MEKVSIRLATGRDKAFMENIIEKYLHEMSAFKDITMDSVGHYTYPHLDSYFRRDMADSRRLYLIEVNRQRIGFAMMNKVSPYAKLDDNILPEGHEEPDWCMAEFTVFPRMRSQGIGREAAELIVAENPGKWELMFDDRNTPASALWSEFSAAHDGNIQEIDEHLRILSFDVLPCVL